MLLPLDCLPLSPPVALRGPSASWCQTGRGKTMKNLFLLVLSREWMGMGEWDDYY